MANPTSTADDRIVLTAVQWAKLRQIEHLEPISDRDYQVLRDLREVLLHHGYEDRFGVCLLHKHFDLAEGEIALEQTDEVARVSTITVVRDDDCSGAMETAWRFSAADEIRSGRNCTLKCQGFGMTGHSKYHECKTT
jgi:hypothetical protein